MLAVPALNSTPGFAVSERAETPDSEGAFPPGDYTPFGYLDNPFHSWNLHRSGILRSSPGIGFGFYFPAGPGGYFDFAKNGVYECHLRLGFLVNGHQLWTLEDFRPGQLSSPYHSKNLFTYAFTEQGTRIEATFFQVGEDALAAKLTLEGTTPQLIKVMAVLDCRLGGTTWWGRDGLTGNYDPSNDSLWIRSFAAGKVFTLLSETSSQSHFFGESEKGLEQWLTAAAKAEQGLTYHPKPLRGALLFNIDMASGGRTDYNMVLARAENVASAYDHARESLGKTREQFAIKYGEDAAFWKTAPRLEGDWPDHWKHGWVYDLETLRMIVRRPIGIYRHPWDAMQIQAPRTVLAETSIDMWALSYADPETAKEVFLGQFANAPTDNVPCSREDGEMNMVAADGAECGTAISWCHPFFCAASIWARTRDKRWLSKLYPLLGRFLRWTLENRSDSEGYINGKCSWETGMDASSRFLIQQPTGGELIEFLRIVELQSATAHAAQVMGLFAGVLGDTAAIEGWRKLQQVYSEKTQTLWKKDWFYDFDTRNGQLVTSVAHDLGQVAPVFSGVASHDQMEKLRPALRKFYSDSMARHLPASEDWQDGLHWSSLVLPYLESLWMAGEKELVSQVVHTIAERIYTTMDRRTLAPPGITQKLGWPGVSCEVWGGEGAYGGEGYGWGAVLPAHIIRNLIGFRDPLSFEELSLSPNLPESLMVPGKSYGVRNLQLGGATLEIMIHVLEARRLRLQGKWSVALRTVSVKDSAGKSVAFEDKNSSWQFEGDNRQPYFLSLAGVPALGKK